MKHATKKKIIDFIKKLLNYNEGSLLLTHALVNNSEIETFNIQELYFEGTFPQYCTIKKEIIEKEIAKSFASQLIQNEAFQLSMEIVDGFSCAEPEDVKVTAKMKYLTNYNKTISR